MLSQGGSSIRFLGYVPKRYPPIALTADTQTISNQAYGNGTYTVSANKAVNNTSYALYKGTSFDSGNGNGFVYFSTTDAIPLQITNTYPVDVDVKEYVIKPGDGFTDYIARDWTVNFYDGNDNLVATDTQTSIVFGESEVKVFHVSAAGVRRVVWNVTSSIKSETPPYSDKQFIYGTFLIYGTGNEVPVPSAATESLVATSLATMDQNSIDASTNTPYAGIANLPDFLVGVPFTKNINWDPTNQNEKTFSFDSGGIHAYGFRDLTWAADQAGTTQVYEGPKYDGVGGGSITRIVHIYFADASFTLNGRSYIWFFTRTPPSEASAIFNA